MQATMTRCRAEGCDLVNVPVGGFRNSSPMAKLVVTDPERAREEIRAALKRHAGDVKTAAMEFKVSWRSLYRWLGRLRMLEEAAQIRGVGVCPECKRPLRPWRKDPVISTLGIKRPRRTRDLSRREQAAAAAKIPCMCGSTDYTLEDIGDGLERTSCCRWAL